MWYEGSGFVFILTSVSRFPQTKNRGAAWNNFYVGGQRQNCFGTLTTTSLPLSRRGGDARGDKASSTRIDREEKPLSHWLFSSRTAIAPLAPTWVTPMSIWKIIIREFLIFVGSVSILPTLVLALLAQQHSWNMLLSGAVREVLSGAIYSHQAPLGLWVRLLAPYLLVQSIRAWYWSQRSVVGMRWAHLYFSLVFAGVAFWSLSAAWDLFHFMTALGDMPAEIGQFLELEGSNLVIGLAAVFLTVHCARIFLNPSQRRDSSA